MSRLLKKKNLVLDHQRSLVAHKISLSACRILHLSNRFCTAPDVIDTCSTLEDNVCAAQKITELLTLQALGSHPCTRPCRATEYTVVKKANPDYRREVLNIFVGIGTNDVNIMEEYLVYDFNNIVSSVGGSLGLFLGFSCLEVCRKASKRFLGNPE